MKVFITGATGVLGKRVAQILLNKGHHVTGLSRSEEKSKQLKNIGADFAQIDLFNQKEIIEATKDCDALLHLATSIPQKTMPKSKDWLMNDRIRVEGTKKLISAAKQNGIHKFIGQSITALFGQQNGEYITEKTPLPARQIKMLESAFEMEQLITERLAKKAIILRFGTFYSADAFHTQDLLSNIKKRKMPLIGDGNYYWNFIHTDDAAAAIVFSLENFERLAGETLNITDFEPVLSKDLLNELSAILDVKKPIRLPHWVIELALGKDVHGFLTNSYKIRKSEKLEGLELQKGSFLSEISKIVQQV